MTKLHSEHVAEQEFDILSCLPPTYVASAATTSEMKTWQTPSENKKELFG